MSYTLRALPAIVATSSNRRTCCPTFALYMACGVHVMHVTARLFCADVMTFEQINGNSHLVAVIATVLLVAIATPIIIIIIISVSIMYANANYVCTF